MGRARQVLERIQRALNELTGTQKLLIGSLAVLMVMTLFLVTQYAGRSDLVPLSIGNTPEDVAAVTRSLDAEGIEYKVVGGSVMVPAGRRQEIVARLAETGSLPSDTTLLLNNLIERQSWTMSSRQTEQQRQIAVMNELSGLISRFDGVRDARVLIDAPEQMGLGRAVRKPTAAVTVFTRSRPLRQQDVDAIARLVAGSLAGLEIDNVRVIDGSNSRQWRPRGDDDMYAATYMESSLNHERVVRDKLLDVLRYIPGVIIAVNAQVDVRRVVAEESRVLEPGRGTVTAPLREFSSETVQRQATRGYEPGVRPNTGLTIDESGVSGESSSQTESEAEFTTQFGRRVEHTVDPGGAPIKINATVNIPRSFIAALWRQQGGEANAEPTEDDLRPLSERVVAQVREQVEPQLESPLGTGGARGEAIVNIIPDLALAGGAGGVAQAGLGGAGAPGSSGGGGALALLEGGAIKTIVLGALAFAALAMMALTVRKATKHTQLPSAEELIGMPPSLHGESDLVGEAGEADSALAGIELGDDQIKATKVLEQVEELVREKPGDAAGILNRWILADQ